jgi:hypothetical protein
MIKNIKPSGGVVEIAYHQLANESNSFFSNATPPYAKYTKDFDWATAFFQR